MPWTFFRCWVLPSSTRMMSPHSMQIIRAILFLHLWGVFGVPIVAKVTTIPLLEHIRPSLIKFIHRVKLTTLGYFFNGELFCWEVGFHVGEIAVCKCFILAI